MATVQDIGVNVFANSAQFGSEMEKVRREGKQAFAGLAGDVEGFAHKLHEGLGAAREFRSLTELGFGLGIGREAFEQMHQGVLRMVEGFHDAAAAGEDIPHVLGDALRSAIGVKTEYQEAAERAKDIADAMEKAAKARERGREMTEGPHHAFPNMPDPKGADDIIKSLTEARDKLHEIMEKDAKLLFGGGRLSNRDEVSRRYQAERSNYDLADTQLQNQKKEFEKANRDIPIGKAFEKAEGELAEAQQRQAEKAKHEAERGIESVYRGMAEKAKEQAQLVKRFESPMEQAIEKMKELESVRTRLSPDSYKLAHDKIVDDYAKTKERDHPHDIGGAEDYNTAAGYAAVEQSRQALMGLQDKQSDILEAQRDIQSKSLDKLTDIAVKLGSGTSITNVDFL